MTPPTSPFILLLTLATASPTLAQTWRTEAETLRAAGDDDGALARVEEHLHSDPSDAAGWALLAELLEDLVEHEGRSSLLLHDAVAAWDRVGELRPEDGESVWRAARVRLLLGEHTAAADGARRALDLGGERAPSRYAALELRALAAGLSVVEPADVEAFVTRLRELEARIAALRGHELAGFEHLAAASEWYASMGAGERAVGLLRRTIGDAPDSIELHRALVDLFTRSGIEERLPGIYARLVDAHPRSAIVHWYAGYVARLAGDLAARERRNDEARELYGSCVVSMRRATELDPGLAESALWVEVQARTASGWSALDAGDLGGAERAWLAVIEEDPELVDLVDGLGRTAGQGLGRLGGRYHVRDEIPAAERVSRRLAEVSREAWKWNNVAYLLREIASDTERAGGEGAADVARSTFLESWKAYRKATSLAPHEPRIINDTALIQVYHLRDDLDEAERMLNDAIRLGEAQLDALGPDPSEEERFPIAMAVGDAYQNLGFLYYRLRDDPIRAREYFLKSVETDSGVRRGVVASIRAIDAGRTLRELNPRTGGPPEGGAGGGAGRRPSKQEEIAPMLSSPPQEVPGEGGRHVTDEEPPDVDWERSLELARQEGIRTGRRVLVYYRVGGGLGPSVEYLQRYLHSSGFAATARGAVTVLADGLRHTFTDRRRDGRLVLCPRARGVSCGEHVACAVELERLWQEAGMGRVSRDSNGLYELIESGLERVTRVEDTFERFSDPGTLEGSGSTSAAGHRPSEHWRTATSGELARSGLLGARRELERRLFDPLTGAERADALRAVSEHPGEDNDALLRALVAPAVEPGLAFAALRAWRAELGPAAPLAALQWAGDPAIKRAAAQALTRCGGVERELFARWLMADLERSASDLAAVARAEVVLGGLELRAW